MNNPVRTTNNNGEKAALTLIRGARVYTPEDVGYSDLLLAGGLVAAVSPEIDLSGNVDLCVVDGRDCIVTPGLIDLHVHITGGGGEGGPATRTPEIEFNEIAAAGVTTVVGLLGTDDISRSPAQLLAKALGLEQQGLNAFILSGSYAFPPAASITDSLKKDLMLIPHVLGVGELALSDHRSSQPTFEDLARVAAEARVGGMLGAKAGLVNLHMGPGARGFDLIFRLVGETEIPAGQLLPTHVNRNRDLFDQALRFAALGGNIDVTIPQAGFCGDRLSLVEAIEGIQSRDLGLDCLTLSTDANGSLPKFNGEGELVGMDVGRIDVMRRAVRALVGRDGLKPENVLPLVTSNTARRLKIFDRTGELVPGKSADVTVFDRDWNVRRVYARGRLLFDREQAVA